MKIVGIIAEYNPFHKGHEFHIEKAKEITGADAVIVVMSGDYVQRGMPAIMPKHLRAQMALACGADVVLELPVCYATGSAEYFATGAVSLLNDLGCVDYLCFGSECGDITSLQKIADVLCQEPADYKMLLQKYLKSGTSFPAARKSALTEYFEISAPTEYLSDSDIISGRGCPDSRTINSVQIGQILDSPNNILGIEYLKALTYLKSPMIPFTIARIGAGYHDQTLGESMSSASAIRQGILTKGIADILPELPEECHKILTENYNRCFPVFADDFSLLLKAKLLTESKNSLSRYLDVTQDIANRIITRRNDFITFSQFCDLLKTKNLTYSRISRCLIHILLGIRGDDVPERASGSRCDCIRLLGFRTKASWILSSIKKDSSIPFITKLPQDHSLKNSDCSGIKVPDFHMLSQNIYASDLYESVVTDKYHTHFKNEYKKQIIRF